MSDNKRKGLSPEGIRKIAMIAATAIIEVAAYTAIINTEFYSGYVAMYIIAGLLFVGIFISSGAGLFKNPKKEDLRASWSDKKKEKFLAFLIKGKTVSYYLKIILLPLLFIIGYDIVKLVFFS